MLSLQFYNGKTREYRYTEFDASTTLALWTPRASAVIAFDSITISNNGAAGTFLFAWSNSSSNTPGAKIFTFTVGASATVSPQIGLIEGTIMDQPLFGRPSSGATGQWSVTVTGFETGLGANA